MLSLSDLVEFLELVRRPKVRREIFELIRIIRKGAADGDLTIPDWERARDQVRVVLKVIRPK